MWSVCKKSITFSDFEIIKQNAMRKRLNEIQPRIQWHRKFQTYRGYKKKVKVLEAAYNHVFNLLPDPMQFCKIT